MAVQDRQVPQPHAAALTGRLDEAADAAAELQAQDLRAYGFNPPVTTSDISTSAEKGDALKRASVSFLDAPFKKAKPVPASTSLAQGSALPQLTTAQNAYCRKYIQAGGCVDPGCHFPHIEKEEIHCPFLTSNSKCVKGETCDWKH